MMARAFFKRSGGHKWLAALGTERFGNPPKLTPTPSADEGPAGGIQRLLADSAGGGEAKMKERGKQLFHQMAIG